MKTKTQWWLVMFGAVIAMLIGVVIAFHGLETGNKNEAYLGLILVGTVCVSWWFWVMFIIKSMLELTTVASNNLGMMKSDITEVKYIVRDLNPNR